MKNKKNGIDFQIKIRFIINSFLYFFLQIYFIKADDGCLISNNSIITEQWLNNIICLGDKDLRYVNFASFSNGDMVVETTAIPDSPKRFFYGIKKDGKPFFSNGDYYATIEVSGQIHSNNSRYEGEIFVVPIDGKEYLFSIGKGNNKYVELYDLEACEIISQELSTTFVNAKKIISIFNSVANFKIDDKNYFMP